MSKEASLLIVAALGAAVPACAVDDDHATVDDTGAIIGGKPADSPALDAIGALVADPDGDGTFAPFCTGTLIAPALVLTAEQCARAVPVEKVAFAIGPDASRPRARVAGKAFVVEDTVDGGVLGLGVDVAVLHLREPVAGVTPMPVAALTADRVGRVFTGYGYGLRDRHGRSGTRRVGKMQLEGTSGKVLELVFGSFHDFLDDGARRLFPHLDPHDREDRKVLRRHYDHIRLLDGLEAWLGDGHNDAQACAGDGGGPLTRTENGVEAVFGVASWVFATCEFGSAYAAMSPPALDLVSYETACPLVPRGGACEGSVAVRCTEPNEGDRRLARLDCAELDLTCGVDDDGVVGCVDPCDGLPAGGRCDGDTALRCTQPSEGTRRVVETDCSNLLQTCGTDATGAVACVDPH